MLFMQLMAGCLVQMAPYALLCFAPFARHLRFSRGKTLLFSSLLLILLAALFAGVSCVIDAQMPDDPRQLTVVNAVFFACLLPCMGWYHYAVRVDWQRKLFIFVFALTSALTITSVQNAFVAEYPTRFMPYKYPTLLVLPLVTVVLVSALLVLLRTCYVPVAEGLSAKETGTLDVMSLLLFLMLAAGLVPLDYQQLQNPSTRILFFVLLASIFVIYTVVFRMLAHAHSQLEIQQALEQTALQLQINREQSRRVMENISDTKRLRHDIRHHAVALQGLLKEGRTEEALAYIDRTMEGLNRHELPHLCQNPVVDALLGHYTEKARDAGITCTLCIDLPEKTGIDDDDMAVLLGNLLENAIRASSQATPENRHIVLNMICSGQMMAVTVDNSFAPGTLRRGQAGYPSTKENHVGLGLANIQRLAEKYMGGVEFRNDDAEFHSSVMLNMLPAPAKP